MKTYSVYITQNLLEPAKAYVGMHNNSANKWYYGSDHILNEDIKKIGKNNFSKTILGTFDNWQECHYWEGFYVRTLQTHRSQGGYNRSWTGGNYTDIPHNKGKKTPPDIIEKTASKLRGSKRTEEQRIRIVSSITGIPSNKKGIPRTDQEKTNISEGTKRAMQDPELRKRMSNTLSIVMKGKLLGKKQQQVTCPYCLLEGGISNLTRYHFENCKHKPIDV